MNFLELVKARYSARKYANRPVEAEKLDYIMECVRMAPSAVNFQPWRFRIVTDEAMLEALQQCYKREWLATAPCIIVACTNPGIGVPIIRIMRILTLPLPWNIFAWRQPSRDWALAGFVTLMPLNAVKCWACPEIWNRLS